MERGKLSRYTFKERSDASGPYHKLQRWQDGKNHTRMFPPTNCRGPDRPGWLYPISPLTEQYADFVIQETARTSPAQKKIHPARNPPRPRREIQQLISRFESEELHRKRCGPIGSLGAHGRFSNPPMPWSAGCSSKPPTESTPSTNPRPDRRASAGKRLGFKGFLAASSCSEITTITRARIRATIRSTLR